jgi:transcriptional regulator with XRE-family HTH domain
VPATRTVPIDTTSRGTLLPGLLAARLAAALTQGELAARAGTSRSTVAYLEAGTRRARPRTVRALARALGVAPAALYAAPAEDR